jgi:flagellar protein FliO/FliZ
MLRVYLLQRSSNIFISFLALSLFALGPISAYGQVVSEPRGVTGAAIWFVFVTLSLLAVLLAVVYWLYRKGGIVGSHGSGIEILASQAVGPRERIVVARIGGRLFLLGHTPSNISLVAELDHFDSPVGVNTGSTDLTQRFATKLESLLQQAGSSVKKKR